MGDERRRYKGFEGGDVLTAEEGGSLLVIPQ